MISRNKGIIRLRLFNLITFGLKIKELIISDFMLKFLLNEGINSSKVVLLVERSVVEIENGLVDLLF